MASYTENYNLIKPEDEEYYDVADFNENMDIIDEALAENAGSTDKIGEPEDTVLNTVFGKLNGFISSDGQGVRIIKSIQRKTATSSGTETKTVKCPISEVDSSRCIVLFERTLDTASFHTNVQYALSDTMLSVTFTFTSGHYLTIASFWIIEFY